MTPIYGKILNTKIRNKIKDLFVTGVDIVRIWEAHGLLKTGSDGCSEKAEDM